MKTTALKNTGGIYLFQKLLNKKNLICNLVVLMLFLTCIKNKSLDLNAFL